MKLVTLNIVLSAIIQSITDCQASLFLEMFECTEYKIFLGHLLPLFFVMMHAFQSNQIIDWPIEAKKGNPLVTMENTI
jgi:hypothetical protein